MKHRPYEPSPTWEEVLKREKERLAPPKKWVPEVGEIVFLLLPVKVMRDWGTKVVDVCDDNGNCLQVSKKALTRDYFKTEYTMKAMRDACLTVAKQLAQANNKVTTLEVKQELRRDYPYYYWSQQVVSDYMAQFAGDGIFTYIDNGTFRTYSLVANPSLTAGPVSKAVNTKTLVTDDDDVLGKMAGTIPTFNVPSTVRVAKAVTKKRGRPKTVSTSISQSDAVIMASDTSFQYITVERKAGPVEYSAAAIKAQKKSAKGFAEREFGKISQIIVANKTYQVK